MTESFIASLNVGLGFKKVGYGCIEFHFYLVRAKDEAAAAKKGRRRKHCVMTSDIRNLVAIWHSHGNKTTSYLFKFILGSIPGFIGYEKIMF